MADYLLGKTSKLIIGIFGAIYSRKFNKKNLLIQLSVNYDKSKYLLIGSQKFRNEMIKTLKDDPMNMGVVGLL